MPADIRDITYDIANFEMSPKHIIQTVLDALSLLPVVGALKYTDEAGDVLKAAAKHGDEAAETVNAVKKVTDFSGFSKQIHLGKQGKRIEVDCGW